MAENELDLINNSTDIYDEIDPIIKKKVKEPFTFQKILKITQDFMQKNETKLSTNIIGKQVLVNQKMEDDIYNAFGLEKNKVKDTIMNSKYFRETFGRELSLMDQLCLAVPLIFGALEYKRIGKQEASELCYLLAHFKPYASRESLFFKYGVNEPQMLYTVEKSLSERFDLKKYGTIIAALKKRAASSYENYITPLKQTEKMTDKRFYVAYTSGIASSVNSFIGGIVEMYKKNEGKSLDYEASAVGVFDKDDDSIDYEDADIQSDVAIRNQIVNKILITITKNPINTKIVQIAAQSGFNSSSEQYRQMLSRIITDVTDKMFGELNLFFTSFIGTFLFNTNADGKRYTLDDFNSQVFLKVGIDTLVGKKSNVKDTNLLTCRNIFKKMLNEHSQDYLTFGNTYKRKLEVALASYWVFLIKTVR